MNIQRNKAHRKAASSEPLLMSRKMAGGIVADGKKMAEWLAKRQPRLKWNGPRK